MTLTETSPSELPLSTLLRTGSRQEHTAAESSSFIGELLAGHVSHQGYRHYLSLLRRVYERLEGVATRLHDDPIAAGFVDPTLERLAAIDTDLAHWGGLLDVESPAVDAYVERIEQAASWGGLFVAHHYTRYLGDLSGGQAIGRILDRELDLGGRGLSFYRFAGIEKPKLYKDAYRARLDALVLTSAERHRMLDEVKTVFGLNGGLFEELTAWLPRYAR